MNTSEAFIIVSSCSFQHLLLFSVTYATEVHQSTGLDAGGNPLTD